MSIEYLADDIDQIGNDLYAKIKCIGCAEKNKESHDLKFVGYNDYHFFMVVNKDFREHTCNHCKTVWMYKWTLDGVELKKKVYK